MQHDRVRRIPVVDEGHRVVGVIAQADIARQIGPREPKAVEQVLEAISQPDAG
jgi:CBS domain-containing protein